MKKRQTTRISLLLFAIATFGSTQIAIADEPVDAAGTLTEVAVVHGNYSRATKLLYDSAGDGIIKGVTITNLGPANLQATNKLGSCNYPDEASECSSDWTNWCAPTTIGPHQTAVVSGTEVLVGLEGFIQASCHQSNGNSWQNYISGEEAEFAFRCDGLHCKN